MLKWTLVIAAIAAATVIPLAAAPAAPTGGFVLEAKLDLHSTARVDNRPRGESPGDVSVFSAALRRDGRPDGRAEFVQTLVDPRYEGLSIRADLALADGTLELQGIGLDRRPPGGAKPAAQTDLAIVGGTGAYAGATGTVHLTPTGHTSQRLQVNLAAS